MTKTNLELLSPDIIEQYQFEKLLQLLHYVEKNSPFYKKLFSTNNININDIRSLLDLNKLPTTTKDDIQLQNWNFLSVSKNEIREYTTTSGTSGTPVTIALTKSDLERLAYNEFLSYQCIGVVENEVIQLALTLDKQFMAGIAYYLGADKAKCTVVRTGPGLASMQWETIFRVNTTTLVIVPSFILKLIEFANENGIDLSNTPVKRALCIGENLRNENFELNNIAKKIKEKWDIELFSTYASSEMQSAFTECIEGNGGHLHPELLIAEVLDDDGKAVEPGKIGELTITTLGIEGMPLIRYRTGDLCTMYITPCKCGRNTPRISPIMGRKQQMIKFKGTTLYPPAIFEILNAQKDIKDYLVEVTTNELGTDDILIHIAASEETEKLTASLKSYLHASLRVRPEIKFSAIEEIQKQQVNAIGRKLSKFIDKRKP